MAEEKEKISTYMKHTKNCQTLDENKENDFAWYCRIQLDELNEGGAVKSYFSAPKYLAANAAVAIVGFLGVFALAFTIPALFRRYWRWLNT